ncbi:hypothetical protein [Actinomadura rugatobispora]|uniref:Uncharacterized protein n=1 Tax=Actinomadura rugatobispora TaxID=1994 RepID=A0ABW1AAP8_9ACTN|nr:hypothetical protein GCM10010200_067640 [Actinomadura rugatobispora]
MNTYGHGLDRDAAERLLDGGPGDPRSGSGALAGVLAAASAPARAGELAGEDAAVSAFQVATVRRSAAARRRGSVFVRLVPLKIAAVVLGTATAASGMVLAGGAMGLPVGPLSSGRESPPPSIPLDRSTSTARPDSEPHAKSGTASPKSSRPALVNLCRVYLAVDPPRRAQELGKPTLRALVDAAGGANRVPGYCAALTPSPGKTQGRDDTATGDGNKKKSTKGPNRGNDGQGEDEGSGGDDDNGDGNGNGNGNGNGPRPSKGAGSKPDKQDSDGDMNEQSSGAPRQRPTAPSPTSTQTSAP